MGCCERLERGTFFWIGLNSKFSSFLFLIKSKFFLKVIFPSQCLLLQESWPHPQLGHAIDLPRNPDTNQFIRSYLEIQGLCLSLHQCKRRKIWLGLLRKFSLWFLRADLKPGAVIVISLPETDTLRRALLRDLGETTP